MITAGDVQFEPPAQKVVFLTSSIAITASGDLSFHSKILLEVNHIVQERVKERPKDWIFVKDVVDLYLKERNNAKIGRSELQILGPLNLDRNSFITRQKSMDSEIVKQITQELVNFDLPEVSTIIMGVDQTGDVVLPHIYTVHDSHIRCDNSIGFSAIGSGGRHAESQFMLARHAWNRELSETLLLTYSAKKDSEIAPGVGVEIDMFMIGPGLGQATMINEGTIKKLEAEHRKLKRKLHKAQTETKSEIRRYVEELGHHTATAQAERPAAGREQAPDESASGNRPEA